MIIIRVNLNKYVIFNNCCQGGLHVSDLLGLSVGTEEEQRSQSHNFACFRFFAPPGGISVTNFDH